MCGHGIIAATTIALQRDLIWTRIQTRHGSPPPGRPRFSHTLLDAHIRQTVVVGTQVEGLMRRKGAPVLGQDLRRGLTAKDVSLLRGQIYDDRALGQGHYVLAPTG